MRPLVKQTYVFRLSALFWTTAVAISAYSEFEARKKFDTWLHNTHILRVTEPGYALQ